MTTTRQRYWLYGAIGCFVTMSLAAGIAFYVLGGEDCACPKEFEYSCGINEWCCHCDGSIFECSWRCPGDNGTFVF